MSAFKAPDDELFEQLALLTERGLGKYREAGYV